MSHLSNMLALGLLAVSSLSYANEPVNINRADAATLAQAIAGVGVARAEAIVQYRKKHGPFESIEDLTLVRGIGDRTVEENRRTLTVD